MVCYWHICYSNGIECVRRGGFFRGLRPKPPLLVKGYTMKVLHGRIHERTVELLDGGDLHDGAHVLVLVLEGEMERAAARSSRLTAGQPVPEPVVEHTHIATPTTVGEVMTEELVTVNPRMPVTEAMHLMAAQGITSVLVEPGAAGGWGIMTMRDVLSRIVRANRSAELIAVGELASRPLITVAPEMSIGECSDLLIERRIRRIVILQDERPIGIVSDTDIFRVVEQHGWGSEAES